MNINHILPRFLKKVHTYNHNSLNDQKLDLRELPHLVNRISTASKHSVDNRIAKRRSHLNNNISLKRCKIDNSKKHRIRQSIGKLRIRYRLGIHHLNLNIFTQIDRKICGKQSSVMFKNNLQGTKMLLGKFRRTGKIVFFNLFFIAVFNFFYIQFTGTKRCQQTVYLILR